MRVSLMAFALAALVSGAPAENHDLTTAILVQPIHDAQVVHADDGKDHVDYELLVVNAFAAPGHVVERHRPRSVGKGARPDRG